ncbi:MAG: DNA repair protein RadC [Candidatus Methylomirabilales bacterium]
MGRRITKGKERDVRRRRYPIAISEWPEGERPRERLLTYGPQHLTTAELLGILCRTGVKGRSAVDLGRELLHTFDGLRGLTAADPEDLKAIKGLGKAKIAQLQAALELGRRALSEVKRITGKVESSQDVYEFLLPEMRDLKKEIFRVLLLNGQNEILEIVTASEGSLTESPVYPREIIQLANRYHAAALIFAHNHPSGNPKPSATDKVITEELVFAGKIMRVKVLDHVIIGEHRYFSFADAGLIQEYEQAYDRRRP